MLCYFKASVLTTTSTTTTTTTTMPYITHFLTTAQCTLGNHDIQENNMKHTYRISKQGILSVNGDRPTYAVLITTF